MRLSAQSSPPDPRSLARPLRGVCSPYGAPAMPALFLASNVAIGMDRYKNKPLILPRCLLTTPQIFFAGSPTSAVPCTLQIIPANNNNIIITQVHAPCSSLPYSKDLLLPVLLSLLLFLQTRVPGFACALNLMLLLQLERKQTRTLGNEMSLPLLEVPAKAWAWKLEVFDLLPCRC